MRPTVCRALDVGGGDVYKSMWALPVMSHQGQKGFLWGEGGWKLGEGWE